MNINMILLDSTARSHFYRSLPTVVQTFNEINKNLTAPAEILDFELFQSLHGHTAENIHALFTGTMFPKHWTNEQRESVTLNPGVFFRKFASAGYRTVYQDDLCYDAGWGMKMDMGMPDTWNNFLERLSAAGIDNGGLTQSSCFILNHNNVKTPFNGPEGPLCFNGRFHHDYYLDYLHERHEAATRRGVPLVTFTGLNTAHDHTGRRVQSLDFDLSRFVRRMSRVENTLTILFADHGNTYTTYTHAVTEGRFEQFHPSFFIILPDGVKKMLGKQIVENLRDNQKKLLTMMDIHSALTTVPSALPQPVGLFGQVPADRTCDDLELRLPNLCVCEGWDTKTVNDTMRAGIVTFVVGTLNNRILAYQKKLRAIGSVPSCRRLVPLRFENVRERSVEGGLITSLDFHTEAGHGATQHTDIFHAEVQLVRDPSRPSFDMQLLSFDRVTKYGPYRVCADEGIDVRLCVCDMVDTKQIKHGAPSLTAFVFNELLPVESKLASSDVNILHTQSISPCLYFRTTSLLDKTDRRTNENSVNIFSSTYEVANQCSYTLKLRVVFEADNMKLSTTTNRGELSLVVDLSANGVTYIGNLMRDTPYWPSSVNYVAYEVVN